MGSFLKQELGGWVECLGFGVQALWAWILAPSVFCCPSFDFPSPRFSHLYNWNKNKIIYSASLQVSNDRMYHDWGRKYSLGAMEPPGKGMSSGEMNRAVVQPIIRKKPQAYCALGQVSEVLSSGHLPTKESEFIISCYNTQTCRGRKSAPSPWYLKHRLTFWGHCVLPRTPKLVPETPHFREPPFQVSVSFLNFYPPRRNPDFTQSSVWYPPNA